MHIKSQKISTSSHFDCQDSKESDWNFQGQGSIAHPKNLPKD